MFKKIIALLFVISVSVALVSCSDTTDVTETQATNSVTTTVVTDAVTTTTVVTDTIEILDTLNIEIDFAKGEYEDYSDEAFTVLNGDSESYEITTEGTYVLEGTITETITINVLEDEDVRLVLNNVTIDSSLNQAIVVISADDIVISVPEGTSNYLSDSETYDVENEDLDAAIYSDADLIINGSGYLEVTGNYNNTIQTKDDLMICDVTLDITSVDDGIIGKDSLLIQNANITSNTEGDAFKSTNDDKEDEGYIYIESGVFNITSESDAMKSVNFLYILDGVFNIETDSNAFKVDTDIYLAGGTYVITTDGDSISADGLIYITGGTFEISTNDDAIKSDVEVRISGGSIDITSCLEGIAAPLITITGGTFTIVTVEETVNVED